MRIGGEENKFANSEVVKLHFLDFFGYGLYHLNKIFFKEEIYPSQFKIFLWDKIFTPISYLLDKILMYKLYSEIAVVIMIGGKSSRLGGGI